MSSVAEMCNFCLFHNFSEDDDSKTYKQVLYEGKIVGLKLTTEGKYNKKKTPSGSKTSKGMAAMAYLISNLQTTDDKYFTTAPNGERVPLLGELHESPAQFIIWSNFGNWHKQVKSIWATPNETGHYDNYIDKCINTPGAGTAGRNNWIRKHEKEIKDLQSRANTYANYLSGYNEPVNKGSTITKYKIKNNRIIYGPFKVQYNETLMKSNSRYVSGLYQVDVENCDENDWYVCDKNGNRKSGEADGVASIKSNKEFYISVPDTYQGGNLKLTFRHLVCSVHFFTVIGSNGSQDQMYVVGYHREMIESELNIDLPTPDLTATGTIFKYEKGTDNPIQGVTLGYKNWEPDDERYKTRPREPLTSDSKYHYTVYVPGKREKRNDKGEIVKDKDGNTVYEDYTYPEDRFDSSEYDADYKEYEEVLENYNYYIKSKTEYIATGVTKANGAAELTGDIRPGTYDLYEISCDDEYFEIEGETLKVKAHRPGTQVVIYNERTGVDIEGWIWEEEPDDPKDPADNIMTGEEEPVNGVEVVLKLYDTVVDSTVVSEDGYYSFKRLSVKQLQNYSIEVTYNGMYYKSIPVTFSSGDMEGPGSKMKDDPSSRDALNNKYGTITKNQADSGEIVYKQEDFTSTVAYDTSYPKNSSEDEDSNSVGCKQTTCPGFNVKASTKEAGFNLKNAYHEQECITNVNLGLTIREQPDVTLVKDIDTVKISINGEEHIYKYGERFKQALYLYQLIF